MLYQVGATLKLDSFLPLSLSLSLSSNIALRMMTLASAQMA